MKESYNKDFTDESLRDRYLKGRAQGHLDKEGRDNTGEAIDYTIRPDLKDLAAYIEKLTGATVGDNVRGRK